MRKWVAVLFTPSAWDIINWLQVAFPLLAGGGTALIGGIYDQLPLMWVVVGAALVFASTGVGVVGYRIYIFQRNPEHKLIFVKPCVSRGEYSLSIGFEIKNDALFPIEVRIRELRTSCSERIPNISDPLDDAQFVLAPGKMKFAHDALIDIEKVVDIVMIGRMEVRLVYGHPNSLRFEISKDYKMFIPLDPSMSFQWNDHLIDKPAQVPVISSRA